MALLNQYSFYYIVSYNNDQPAPEPILKTHGGDPGTSIRSWDDHDYWYIEFVNGDAFRQHPLEKIIPSDILRKIKLGEIKLCISNMHEAYHYVIEDIYSDVIIKNNIHPFNILYLTNSYDIGREIDIVSKKYNLPKMKSEFISLFEYTAQQQLIHYPKLYTTLSPNNQDYDKKFISLNGIYRPHRSLLVGLLSCFGLLNEGYVSYNAYPNNPPTPSDILHNFLNDTQNTEKVIDLLVANKEKLLQLDRFYIDTNPDDNWNGPVYGSTNKSFYENTFFSVVTETLCFHNYSQAGNTLGRAISEKTFKPIIHMHPFLIVGVHRVLEVLQNLGYKTFSPYIDESYDIIDNPYERILNIVLEIEKLINLNPTQLKEFQEFCAGISKHNINCLKTKTKFNYPMT